ncbi:MAG: hypothetical protein PHF29_04980 [Candidatus Riflebacteria bacterium]|nr:hypothetical protein [Candidatus Riflebacteria bacterium]
MQVNNQTIIVLCEGSSENAYLQELNRFLREEEKHIVFIPKIIGSGHYKEVMMKYLSERKSNQRSRIEVWIDDDIYIRNERNNMTNYNKTRNKINFLFNVHNFEDFLVLHHKDQILDDWIQICRDHNHVEKPMINAVYEPLITSVFSNYTKTNCPLTSITQTNLDNLFKHNSDVNIFIKSDFGSLLYKLLFESIKN